MGGHNIVRAVASATAGHDEFMRRYEEFDGLYNGDEVKSHGKAITLFRQTSLLGDTPSLNYRSRETLSLTCAFHHGQIGLGGMCGSA